MEDVFIADWSKAVHEAREYLVSTKKPFTHENIMYLAAGEMRIYGWGKDVVTADLGEEYNDYLAKVCSTFGISRSKVYSKNRDDCAVKARVFLYMYLTIKFGKSGSEIGKIFNKNHSTVLHGLGMYRDLVEEYPDLFIENNRVERKY